LNANCHRLSTASVHPGAESGASDSKRKGKFYDARPSDAAASAQALAYIRLLYEVETEAKKPAEKIGGDLFSERHRLREKSAEARLAQFKTWRESQQAEHGGPVLPKSPMGQAIQYPLNPWDALCIYTTDRRLAGCRGVPWEAQWQLHPRYLNAMAHRLKLAC